MRVRILQVFKQDGKVEDFIKETGIYIRNFFVEIVYYRVLNVVGISLEVIVQEIIISYVVVGKDLGYVNNRVVYFIVDLRTCY